MLGHAGICKDMVGNARICWDMLGYGGIWWDMVGCAGMWWDMVGYGGGVLHVVRTPCTCLAKVFFCPPWFLHLLRKLLKLKSVAGAVF